MKKLDDRTINKRKCTLKGVIGNIHSGWRGTLKRIIKNAIHLMEENFHCNPSDIEIYICPSILKCCFIHIRQMAKMQEEICQ